MPRQIFGMTVIQKLSKFRWSLDVVTKSMNIFGNNIEHFGPILFPLFTTGDIVSPEYQQLGEISKKLGKIE